MAVHAPPDLPACSTPAGPTLAPEELAGHKLLALFARAAAQDFSWHVDGRSPVRPLNDRRAQSSESASGLGLYVGADDGNRTRTVSLGSTAITAARGADQASLAVLSDRG
jgi:hypothetical protein